MLFVFPDHLIRIQKDLSGSPEMDAMLHEVDLVLFLIPFKGSFRQIYIKMLKHKNPHAGAAPAQIGMKTGAAKLPAFW